MWVSCLGFGKYFEKICRICTFSFIIHITLNIMCIKSSVRKTVKILVLIFGRMIKINTDIHIYTWPHGLIKRIVKVMDNFWILDSWPSSL